MKMIMNFVTNYSHLNGWSRRDKSLLFCEIYMSIRHKNHCFVVFSKSQIIIYFFKNETFDLILWTPRQILVTIIVFRDSITGKVIRKKPLIWGNSKFKIISMHPKLSVSFYSNLLSIGRWNMQNIGRKLDRWDDFDCFIDWLIFWAKD
jgi:hypothetical protein